MSNETKSKAERHQAALEKAKATLARLKRKEYLEKRDPLPPPENEIWETRIVRWRGEKIKVQVPKWGGKDVV